MQQPSNRHRLGMQGERLASDWLVRRGFRIIGVNVRNALGEIDIIAEESGVIVFVEVKSKHGSSCGLPEEMLTRAKRRQLSRLALAWLQSSRSLHLPARFDVVAVSWRGTEPPQIRHYRNAFPAEEL